jgi:hypothetical protein
MKVVNVSMDVLVHFVDRGTAVYSYIILLSMGTKKRLINNIKCMPFHPIGLREVRGIFS